jgi:hypothetical protein
LNDWIKLLDSLGRTMIEFSRETSHGKAGE